MHCYDRFQLLSAAESGDLLEFTRLLKSGVDVEAADMLKVRAIHMATLKGRLEMVKALIAHGCNVNAKANCPGEERGATPLHLAALHADPRLTTALVRAGADVNERNKARSSPLHVALRLGHLDVARALVNADSHVNLTDDHDVTPLLFAAARNWTSEVELLLKKGAVVNAKSKDGATALHLAAEKGSVKMVNLLLWGEANINAKKAKGMTPLHVALEHKQWEVARLLVECGADVNACEHKSRRPLHIAAYAGSTNKLTQLLIAKGADVNAADKLGRVPLHFAVQYAHPSVANILMQRDAAVNVRDEDGATPLHLATSAGDVNVIKHLVAHGADVNIRLTVDQRTPLHYAAGYHNAEICRHLLLKGSNVNSRDAKQSTPLHLAVSNVNLTDRVKMQAKLDTVKVLVEHGADLDAKRAVDVVIGVYTVTPIHVSIKANDLEVAVYLLKNGACYDTKITSGTVSITTVELARLNHSKRVLKLLYTMDSLFSAILKGDSEGVVNCLKQGAVVNGRSIVYGTPLMYATWKGLTHIVEILAKAGTDVNMGTKYNVTPIHFAAKHNNYSLMCTLLEHGAMYNVLTNSKMKTPEDFAVMCGHQNIADNLRLINQLFQLVEKGNDEVLKDLEELVSNVPDELRLAIVHCKNRDGKTLLDIAVKNKNENICSFLQAISHPQVP